MTAYTKEGDYEAAIERSLQSAQLRSDALKREREDAPKRLARLAGLSSNGHDLLLNNSPSFQTWGLFEILIQTGRKETFTDPFHAEELLHLALKVSAHLDCSFYGKERIEDLRARTWAYIANARRIRMDLQGSEEAFEEASLLLAVGTDDPMEQALIYDLKASLLRIQQNFDESLWLSRRAIATYRRMGETHRVGHSLVNLSIARRYMGNPGEAISLLYQALDLIDRDRDPRLALCALNNLIEDLALAERFMEAQRMVARARPLYQRFPEPMMQTRRLWAEAKVAVGLGQIEKADELLQQVQVGVSEAGTALDQSFLSRDIASLEASRVRKPA
jgi:tetratricopeptide (TPR) repeat protein